MKFEQQAIIGLAEPTEVSATTSGRENVLRVKLDEFIRKKLGLHQKQFAELVGVSPATVCKWLFTDAAPSVYTVQRIANNFGLSFGEALGLFEVTR